MILMRKQAASIGILATVAAMHSALAAEVTWGAEIGTTGAGINAGIPISPQDGLHVRVGANYLRRYAFSRKTEQVAYDFKASLRTIDFLLDWHPWRNGFRLTAGAIYNDNVVNAIGTPNRVATFNFNNETFNTTQIGKLVGQLDFPTLAPYVGIGWQNHDRGERGWSLSSDFGIMYQGSPRTTLAVGGCVLPADACDLAQRLLAPAIVSETGRLNEDLRKYRFFPVARVGLHYRF